MYRFTVVSHGIAARMGSTLLSRLSRVVHPSDRVVRGETRVDVAMTTPVSAVMGGVGAVIVVVLAVRG
jgi:hypothetical protein